MPSNVTEPLVLVAGAVPEPARREPRTYPGRGLAPSADPERLERVLRERMPNAVGAGEDELAAVEARLGVPLPAELRAVLRVTRAEWSEQRDIEALGGVELFGLDGIERASEADVRKGIPFPFLAAKAAVTGPDAAVQGLVDPPCWIVVGDHGGGSGDWVAVDLMPGPAGHVGQLVVVSHEEEIGAQLLAESFTALVLDGGIEDYEDNPGEAPPYAVMVDSKQGHCVAAVATAELEVLRIGVWDAEPSDLTPLVGLPRLRTLIAHPGKIADPGVIGCLKGLEYLEIGPDEWEALLAADAVPRSLLAAGVSGYGHDPARVGAIYRALTRIWS
ncbi:SMI1/KNR4 family protein [Glycomyces sp. NPDC049804]|uniref:SMI1/KNR4 family protein n=1 Tax=Glycomyces sp. NPDC049804 TaxID=3154363 RepID=UPI0034428BFE